MAGLPLGTCLAFLTLTQKTHVCSVDLSLMPTLIVDLSGSLLPGITGNVAALEEMSMQQAIAFLHVFWRVIMRRCVTTIT